MSWICHKCETENPDYLGICEVCGSYKSNNEKTSGVNLTTPVIETCIYDEPKVYDGFSFPLIMPIGYTGKYDWEKIYNEPYQISNPFEYMGSLKRAAENGDIWAQKLLARCFLRGSAVRKDIGEAVKWFIRAAEQGDANAALAAGLWYYKGGDGFFQNKTEGIKWIIKAAELGNVDAKYYLNKKDEKVSSVPYKSNSGCSVVLTIILLILMSFSILS